MVTWTTESWRDARAEQQPSWPDDNALEAAVAELALRPPLVFERESDELSAQLANVARGRAFLLQAGDCAESFSAFSRSTIDAKLRVLLQMAVVLTYSAGVPVVKVGRIAGQYAKPRSSPEETRDGLTLPAYRGDMVNGLEFEATARRPDPQRLLRAYDRAAGTLNLIRALTKGGFAGLDQVHRWNQAFVASSSEGERYAALAGNIEQALRFMRACGLDLAPDGPLAQVDLYTSHEALILPYEAALTRGSENAGYYAGSAHMLWVGERTRQLDGAHLEFVSGIRNPVGVKLGPMASVDDVRGLCRRLDPNKEPGRLTLITRMGAGQVRRALPPLIDAVRSAGHPVVWACDPMHGNTVVARDGYKTRHFETILDEVCGFFEAHREAGSWPGGLHIELTGDAVTECLGGEEAIAEHQLGARYETACDPRLNARQSLDLAFRTAQLLSART